MTPEGRHRLRRIARRRLVLRRPGLVTAVAACGLAFGCTSIKLGSRTEVEGVDGRIISSPFAPEKRENCREVGRHNCRYWDDPSRTVHSQCTESVRDGAATTGVNYIHVDGPKSSGPADGAPVAILYFCENPIER